MLWYLNKPEESTPLQNKLGITLKGAARSDARSSETKRELARRNEARTGGNLRLYVPSIPLQEKLAFLALQAPDVEVYEMLTSEGAKARKTERSAQGNRCEILVVSSSGTIREDLQRVRHAKAAIPGIKIPRCCVR